MRESFKNNTGLKAIAALFVLFTVWWLWLWSGKFGDQENNLLFAACYGSVALFGGLYGLRIASHWGGLKSVFGRAILYLSIGLLAAEFGQLVFSYYNIFLHQEIPYPSLADIGFFANIPLYSLGMFNLARVSGVQFNIHRVTHKLQIVLIPVAMLGLSYYFFLKDYSYDPTQPLKTFLDFGYPFGQAIYVSLALLTYSLTKNTLGGVMRSKVVFLVVAFVAQYFADYNFLYQTVQGTWKNGGYGDYLYFLAYCLMAVGIVQIRNVLVAIRTK